ncbi:hypothetical protein ATEIFO6365_0006016800 [Aspergillus terreus]|uniref:Uncharacterized protein n=1 Tax=Aspergillus terreus TaxID=33178 RepID=A0A5M3YW52_ASPTE|nr:hypothetical protein ATETN484_0005016600 [Aspergillus terreus]GFF16831.1 hypothetical protein ATEIFO6365_0006016800 [Aspergillus terreus]
MTDAVPRYGSDPEASAVARRKKRRASHHRQNTIRACDTCKEKKTRCSGTLPCVRCCRLGIQCEYLSSYSRGLAPPLPPPLSAPDSLPAVYAHSRATSPQQDPTSSCDSINGLLSCPDVQGTEPGPVSGLAFFARVCQYLKSQQPSSSLASVSSLGEPNPEVPDASSVFRYGDKPYKKYDISDIELPPLEQAMHLVAVYFDSAVVTYRFLHRGLVEQWVRQLFEYGVSPSKLAPGPVVVRACIVFGIFAIGALYDQHESAFPLDCDDQSERWFIMAKHLAFLETGPPRLESIQARLNICLYLLASSRASECWFSFGLIVQLMLALGLHRAAPVPPDRDQGVAYLEQELRKRVCWSAYTLDRYISVIFGRPQLFHEEDMDQDLPDEVSDGDLLLDDPLLRSGRPDAVMITSVLHYRLARIVGSISRQLYTSISPSQETPLERAVLLMLELERWKESVPSFHDKGRSEILQLAYSHAIIHATRSLLFIDSNDMSGAPVPSATVVSYIQKCIGAAEEIMTIVDELSNQGRLIQGFWFTHYTCFCAITVVYIYIIRQHQSSSLIGTSSQCIDDSARLRYLFSLAETCQQHLGRVTAHSSPSRRYGLILEELRLEVHRQILSHLRPTRQSISPGGPQDRRADSVPNEPAASRRGVASLTSSSQSSPPTLGFDTHGSMGSLALQADLGDPSAIPISDPMSLGDSADGAAWWAQLDAWAYSTLSEEPSVFTF